MRQPGDFKERLKVLPASWLNGAREPSNGPFLPGAHRAAQPQGWVKWAGDWQAIHPKGARRSAGFSPLCSP